MEHFDPTIDLKSLIIDNTEMNGIDTGELTISNMSIESICVEGIVMWPFYVLAGTTIMCQLKYLLGKQRWCWQSSNGYSVASEG